MFTGIVEEIGTVKKIQKGQHSAVLDIQAQQVLEGLKIGDSIAVNGVCLTVVSFGNNYFAADVMHETLNRSALVRLSSGSRVNLERAMPADGRFGGHIVAGHIDGTGVLSRKERIGNAVLLEISAAPAILYEIVEKGSIAIDGISLTVASLFSSCFTVSIIPHTSSMTMLPLSRIQARRRYFWRKTPAAQSIWKRM